jgi:hypothetical protein
MVHGREYFLAFALFPWFRRATVEELCAVQLLHEEHLYWPKLDVDLDLDRILHPDKYPLVAGTRKDKRASRRFSH